MPRIYHSASSIELGARCRYAWALRYVEGVPDPGTAATELGREVHTTLEAWYAGQRADWSTRAGQIAMTIVPHVPNPRAALHAFSEGGIGRDRIDPPLGDDAPETTCTIHGVRWAGFRDLLVSAPLEWPRLGISPSGDWLLVDFKTTSSIERYARSSVELLGDIQANLYAYDTAMLLGLERVSARWIYAETGKVRRAIPVDFEISREDALEVLRGPATLARDLDQITELDPSDKNPLACGDYGGCRYHVSRGGPCDAQRSVGALIQARVRKDRTMADETATLSLEQIRAKLASVKAAAPAAAAAPSAPELAPEPPPQKRSPGRPPKAAKAPAVEAPETPADVVISETPAQRLVVLSNHLVELEQMAARTRDEIRALLG